MNGMGEAPGKVWFFELAAAVIDADRCIQCGACIAACPSDSLATSFEDLPYLVKMCTGCSLCWDFCPRGGLRYESTWLKDEVTAVDPGAPFVHGLSSEEISQGSDSWRITGADPAPGLGAVMKKLAARVRHEADLKAPRAQ